MAPYWLSPTLWPFPVPVMTKFPSPPPEGCDASPDTVTVPEEVMAKAEFPRRALTVPPPEMTEAPSKEESWPVPLTERPPLRRPLMSKRRLLTDF